MTEIEAEYIKFNNEFYKKIYNEDGIYQCTSDCDLNGWCQFPECNGEFIWKKVKIKEIIEKKTHVDTFCCRCEKRIEACYLCDKCLDDYHKSIDRNEKAKEAVIKELTYRNGIMNISFESEKEVILILAKAFKDFLDESGADNCVQCKFYDAETLKGYSFTVQREEGKTPLELKTEMEGQFKKCIDLLRDIKDRVIKYHCLADDCHAVKREDEKITCRACENNPNNKIQKLFDEFGIVE